MIKFNEQTKIFHLQTPETSYQILISHKGHLAHVYYGTKIGDDDLSYLTRQMEYGFSGQEIFREKHSLLDFLPMEYPTDGIGDFRESALAISDATNHNGVELIYKNHKIVEGTVQIPSLPSVFAEKSKSKTLVITTEDAVLNVEVDLYYSVFDDCDAIVRWAKIKNNSSQTIFVNKALSAAFDMDDNNFDMITLHGSWARERHLDRRPIHMGKQGVVSKRGETSHQEHPFLAILDKTATENAGNVYGVNFIYSGNFVAEVQKNQFDSLRVTMGINPENFSWKLNSGDAFETPQAVLVFSDKGLNGMSHAFHDLYREHLIRSPFKAKPRPILINNWEATYFNFNTEKLLEIARQSKKDGIEMLVMDDGWFGKRNSDNCSLGDWVVNEEKINSGLKNLVEQVNKIGLKFGIWFEPEMISPDSDVFRAHPDWAIQIPGRVPGMSREQLVLDIVNPEARNFAYESVAKILKSANIEYVKWDMNRQLTDIGSTYLGKEQQGELMHRYVLAVYELQERLIQEFPNLLLENCSGGGARFDPGMLYYSPQIWCSDDTDAIERLSIQEGTALIYPLSTMGAHVSDCPNHTVGRVTPFETRGIVALAGTFGYELDVTKITEEDRAMIPEQVAMYHKYNDLVRNGDYYRIASYQQNHYYDCYAVVAKDKSEALVTYVQVLNRPNYHSRNIRLTGLAPEKRYRIEGEERTYYGDTLMNAGIHIPCMWGDFQAKLLHIVEA